MRAFLAIALPDAERDALGELQRKLKGSGLRASWVHPGNFHLTLRFLGDCAEDDIARIQTSLGEVATSHPPLALQVTGLGAFPNPRKASVFWAGLSGELEALTSLQRDIEAAVCAAGLAPETQRFHAHITLARFRRRPPGDAVQKLIDALSAHVGSSFTAREVVLYRSELHPKGARYHRLAAFPLETPPSR